MLNCEKNAVWVSQSTASQVWRRVTETCPSLEDARRVPIACMFLACYPTMPIDLLLSFVPYGSRTASAWSVQKALADREKGRRLSRDVPHFLLAHMRKQIRGMHV